MGKSIAFYCIAEKSPIMAELSGILKKYRVPFTTSPHSSRREALLWAGKLNSTSISVCVVLEEEQGESAVSVAQLVASDIPLVIVPRIGTDSGKFMELLGNVVAVVLPPGNIKRLYWVLTWFAGSGATRFIRPGGLELKQEPIDWSDGIDFSMPDFEIPSESADKLHLKPTEFDKADEWKSDKEDLLQLDRLEKLMSSTVKVRESGSDTDTNFGVVHPSGLDFSLPLRKIMSQAWTVAKTAGNAEVLGVHYLAAAFDTGYGELLNDAGIDLEDLKDFLSEFDSSGNSDQEPVMSEEGFEAVSKAKQLVRLKGGDLVQTNDFLQAILSAHSGSVRTFLETYEIDQQSAVNTVAESNLLEERDNGFFKPTDRDQAEFVEFDTDEVDRVQNQLGGIQGFRDAASSKPKIGGNSYLDNELMKTDTKRVLPKAPDKPKVVTYSGEFPPIDTMEEASDLLLEGQVIAYASDLYFALAAEASNSLAVDRLRQIAGIEPDSSIGIQIHSTSLLKHLTVQKSDKLERLFELYWPGPLAIVLEKSAGVLTAVSPDNTFGVRIPSDNLSLGVLSMFGRPLAVVPFHVPGGAKPTAELVAQLLAGKVAMVLQGDQEVVHKECTVISAVEEPWKVLNSGGMSDESVNNLLSLDS